jgi:hypothetical protein
MHDDEDNPLVSVSPLDDEGSGFTVSYLESPSAIKMTNNLKIQYFEQTDVYLVNTTGTPQAKQTEIRAILSVKK